MSVNQAPHLLLIYIYFSQFVEDL